MIGLTSANAFSVHNSSNTVCKLAGNCIQVTPAFIKRCHVLMKGQQSQQSSVDNTYGQEAQPSLMEKAKAYIPVLGSSTEFDPVSTGKL